MVIIILRDKSGDGLAGQEKGHMVEQRIMLAGTCQKFVSDIVERTLREAIRKQHQEHRVVHMAREGRLVGAGCGVQSVA